MKTFTMILGLLVLLGSIHGQSVDDFFFYIPSDKEMGNFISMMNYLKRIEDGSMKMQLNTIESMFKHYVGENTLESLLTESYLRTTQNPEVREIVSKYIESNGIETSFAKSLLNFYSSEKQERIQDGGKTIVYSKDDELFEENMKFFPLVEVGIIDEKFGTMIFNQKWSQISFEKDGERDSFFIYGGGTNSITMSFDKITGVEENDIEKYYKEDMYKEKYKDSWKVFDLPKEGIHERNGADKYILTMGIGADFISEIESGTFNVFIYTKADKTLYTISYYVNISHINIFYEYRYRMYSYLAFVALMGFIK